jgi:NAD(P)H-flavin reductase
MNDDLYQPYVMNLCDSREEAPDVRTFRLKFSDETQRAEFFKRYRVGQFGLYGVPGEGESTFCVASPPTRGDYIECTFRKVGRVTQALQDLEVGQNLTFRGPYGNHFPIDSWKGRDQIGRAHV